MALTASSGAAGGACGAGGSQSEPCPPVRVAEHQHFPRGGLSVARGALAAPWGEQSSQGDCATPVPPPSKETPGAVPGTWWHQLARGSTVGTLGSWGGWRQEGASAREGSSGWVVCACSPCRGQDDCRPQAPPLSPAAGGQRWVSCRAAGASPSGQGGHGGCGRSGAGAGCHRSRGWLCGMGQLGCHHRALGTDGAAWGAVRKQGRALAASREPRSPAQPHGVPEGGWLVQGAAQPGALAALPAPWSPAQGSHTSLPYLICSFSTTKSRRRP